MKTDSIDADISYVEEMLRKYPCGRYRMMLTLLKDSREIYFAASTDDQVGPRQVD